MAMRFLAVLGIFAVGLWSVALPAAASQTATPIHHVIVIFQENVSFDHYFGTYPHAANLPGEVPFTALPGTPAVNGLTPELLLHNPNKAPPQRLGPKQAATCDMDHEYRAEQQAFDGGKMDRFVEYTSPEEGQTGCGAASVMGYFDGNTVTALWNLAQHFAMSDNFHGTVFGPSTPGAINLISGNTHGATPADLAVKDELVSAAGTVLGDPDPKFDDCASPKAPLLAMKGRNIGDLLNAHKVSWGWFQGGFRPTAAVAGKSVCGAHSLNLLGKKVNDYSPHHEPFEYYPQTANPHHLPPLSVAAIGRTDQANHQYDLDDFYAALKAGNLPQVSFLKAKKAEDGHAGLAYSNPLDEQKFLASVIDMIEKSGAWRDTAIIVTYDDSDGWYDHAPSKIVNGSRLPGIDALDGPGICGKAAAAGGYEGRCGYGPRLPLLIVSPFARVNYVDHRLTDQTSILRFIEDNWRLGRIGDHSLDAKAGRLDRLFDFRHPRAAPLQLNPATGATL